MVAIDLDSSNSVHQNIFLNFVANLLVTQDKALHPFLFCKMSTY